VTDVQATERRRRWSRRLAAAAVLLGASWPGPVVAQADLSAVVERARGAWLAHDVGALVEGADTVRLHIPGISPSASLKPGQAARLIERYLKPTEELSFDLRNVRELAEDHAYAEVERVYVVKGTDEQRAETVFLGFRRIGGAWRLREVRVTP